MANQPNQAKINLKLTEEIAEGIYSNLALINHSPAEFIIDFARIVPGTNTSKVHSRIIMTPQHAKLLSKALESNIKKYEKQFGEIKSIGMPSVENERKIGFN